MNAETTEHEVQYDTSSKQTVENLESPEVRASKYLSFILRHKPEAAGITLNPDGWTDIDILIRQANKTSGAMRKLGFTREFLENVVVANNKKRFTISDDGKRIRAAQGHSTPQAAAMKFESAVPPDVLYHGTSSAVEGLILAEGLKKMSRNLVQLSADLETAIEVGKRHVKGKERLVIFTVRAKEVVKAGGTFFRSENGVWMSKDIDSIYLQKMLGDPQAMVARLKERSRK